MKWRWRWKWRVVWLVTAGVLAAGIGGMWGRSYWWDGRAGYATKAGAGFYVSSVRGQLYFGWSELALGPGPAVESGFVSRQKKLPAQDTMGFMDGFGVQPVIEQMEAFHAMTTFFAEGWLARRGFTWETVPRVVRRGAWEPEAELSGFFRRTAVGVQVPYWFVEGLAMLGFVLLLRPVRLVRGWRRRGEEGVWCMGCGYDLRATPGRCPECGREGLGVG